MTIRHLTIYIHVCGEGVMTRAAEKLHMTQPSVSQAIQELEAHYRVQLFERLGRKLFLTAAGKKLLTYARHIVNLNAQTEAEMRQFGAVYRVRLGASVTVGECVLIDLIRKLYEMYPQNQITSAIHNTAAMEQMLLEDVLDLALIEGEVHSEYLMSQPFMDDELIFIASPNYFLARQFLIEEKDLLKADFFVREEGSGTRLLFDKMMESTRISYRIAGVYNNAETIKKAVTAGLGVSVISRLAVRRELERGELCRLVVGELFFKRQFSIVHHKNKYLSNEIKNIIDICRQLDFS